MLRRSSLLDKSDEPTASSDDEDIGVVPELSFKAYQKATTSMQHGTATVESVQFSRRIWNAPPLLSPPLSSPSLQREGVVFDVREASREQSKFLLIGFLNSKNQIHLFVQWRSLIVS